MLFEESAGNMHTVDRHWLVLLFMRHRSLAVVRIRQLPNLHPGDLDVED
jgi:hypothetical protein